MHNDSILDEDASQQVVRFEDDAARATYVQDVGATRSRYDLVVHQRKIRVSICFQRHASLAS